MYDNSACERTWFQERVIVHLGKPLGQLLVDWLQRFAVTAPGGIHLQDRNQHVPVSSACGHRWERQVKFVTQQVAGSCLLDAFPSVLRYPAAAAAASAVTTKQNRKRRIGSLSSTAHKSTCHINRAQQINNLTSRSTSLSAFLTISSKFLPTMTVTPPSVGSSGMGADLYSGWTLPSSRPLAKAVMDFSLLEGRTHAK